MHADEYARMYAVEMDHWWYRSLHRRVLRVLRREMTPDSPRILDAGCGTGGLAIQLTRLGAVTAMDFSPHALDLCRKRGLTDVVEGSINDLPFPDAAFDAVVSLDVLCHRSVDEARAVAELTRVLRPGGLMVLNLPAYEWLRGQHDVVVHTARRYTKRRVRSVLETAGMEPVDVAHWNTLLFPVAAAARLASRRKLRGDDAPSDVGPVQPLLNAALCGVLSLEHGLMRAVPMPFGLSILALARRRSPR